MKRLAEGKHLCNMYAARLYAGLGEKDEAFRLLDQALAEREPWLPQIRFEPGYDNIQNDPRFKELLRKIGLGHVDLSIPKSTP